MIIQILWSLIVRLQMRWSMKLYGMGKTILNSMPLRMVYRTYLQLSKIVC